MECCKTPIPPPPGRARVSLAPNRQCASSGRMRVYPGLILEGEGLLGQPGSHQRDVLAERFETAAIAAD